MQHLCALKIWNTDLRSEASSWADRWRLAADDHSRHMAPTTCWAPSLRLLFFSCSSSSADLSSCSSCCLTAERLSHSSVAVCLSQSITLLLRDGITHSSAPSRHANTKWTDPPMLTHKWTKSYVPLVTHRPDESRNLSDRVKQLKRLKQQHIMLWSEEIRRETNSFKVETATNPNGYKGLWD